jgi:hypothetical protein
MLGMFRALIAPGYPRRYVGRHRAPSAIRALASAAAVRRAMATPSEQTAN